MTTIEFNKTAPASVARSSLFDRIREISLREIRSRAFEIDKEGRYPVDILRRLGEAGAFAQHHNGFGEDYCTNMGAAITAMSIVAQECLSTAFCTWCQDAFGWYVQNTENTTLRDKLQEGAATGEIPGGTGLSNLMKALSGIEQLRLKGTRVAGGYRIEGLLPWVSNIEDGHYFGICFALNDDPDHLVMALARCGDEGVAVREAARFIALNGTATSSVSFAQAFISEERVLADPARSFVQKIRPGFILLQAGMALGLVRGSIALMRSLPGATLRANAFLPIGPIEIEYRLLTLEDEIAKLAATPSRDDREFLESVLKARFESSQLSLDSAQAAMLHAGARAYVEGSVYARRLRESYFIAIVTPAMKHLAKDIDALAKTPMLQCGGR